MLPSPMLRDARCEGLGELTTVGVDHMHVGEARKVSARRAYGSANHACPHQYGRTWLIELFSDFGLGSTILSVRSTDHYV